MADAHIIEDDTCKICRYKERVSPTWLIGNTEKFSNPSYIEQKRVTQPKDHKYRKGDQENR